MKNEHQMEEYSEYAIPDDEWETIVRNVPIVSVDLLVRTQGGIVLGRRTNEPAKGEWFVPGGTVFKGERLTAAVHRVAKEELGTDVSINHSIGTYQHFYETADVDAADGKHYLATAFIVHLDDERVTSDEQHDELRVFRAPFPELHPYVDRYLDAIGLLDRKPALEDRTVYR